MEINILFIIILAILLFAIWDLGAKLNRLERLIKGIKEDLKNKPKL